MWPMIWPTPYAMTTSTRIGGDNASHITLPIVPVSVSPPHRQPPEFAAIVQDPELSGYGVVPVADSTVSGYAEVKHIERNPLTATTVIRMPGNGGTVYPWATVYYSEELTHEASDRDPAVASALGKTSYRIVQGEGQGEGQAERELILSCDLAWRSDSAYFYYQYTRRLHENGDLLREITWTDKIPRQHH
jgi:hypothetical protein